MAKKRGKYKSNLRGYAAYSKLYDATQAKMNKAGYNMAASKLSREEYAVTYQAEKNDRMQAIREGKRKTVGDINRQFVKEATYEVSQKQASGYVKEMRRQNPNFQGSVRDVRAGKVAINKASIAQRYENLKNNAQLSPFAAGKIIGQEYFGSE